MSSAIVDQATIAGSHFAFQLIVARFASVSEYAAFVLGYTGIALATALHSGLIAEPVLVHVGSVREDARPSYLLSVLRINLWVSCALAGAAAVAGLVVTLYADADTGLALIAMAVAIPAILLQRLTRMVAYGVKSTAAALKSSAVYASTAIAFALALGTVGHMSGWGAYAPLAIGGLAGSVPLLALMARGGNRSKALDHDVRRMHRELGSWSAGAQVLSWVPWNAFLLIVAAFRPADDVAGFRVALTLLLPALHIVWALGPVLVPRFTAANEGGSTMWPVVAFPLTIGVCGAAAFSIALVLARDWLIVLAFGERYLSAGRFAVGLAALPIIAAVTVVMEAYYRAARMQRRVFTSRLAAVVLGLSLGIPLVSIWGVGGAICAQAITLFAGLSLLLLGPVQSDRRRTVSEA